MNPLLSEAVQRNLVLASRSPRRIDILRGLEFEFEVLPAHDHVENGAVVRRSCSSGRWSARVSKRRTSLAGRPRATVIGADTVVIIDGEVLEKPADDDEAFRFLKKLSGREHVVVTGVAIRREADGLDLAAKEKTRVLFRELCDTDIRLYVASGEGRDKAGSYAVQGLGAGLVRSIDGCFYNVVGFPVSLFFDLLRKVRPAAMNVVPTIAFEKAPSSSSIRRCCPPSTRSFVSRRSKRCAKRSRRFGSGERPRSGSRGRTGCFSPSRRNGGGSKRYYFDGNAALVDDFPAIVTVDAVRNHLDARVRDAPFDAADGGESRLGARSNEGACAGGSGRRRPGCSARCTGKRARSTTKTSRCAARSGVAARPFSRTATAFSPTATPAVSRRAATGPPWGRVRRSRERKEDPRVRRRDAAACCRVRG